MNSSTMLDSRSISSKLELLKNMLEEYLTVFDDLETKLKHNHPPMSTLVEKCIYCYLFGNILKDGSINEIQI